jgi:hypothetical protein
MIDNDDWDSEDYEEEVWDLGDYEERRNERLAERDAAKEEQERDSEEVDIKEAQDAMNKYLSPKVGQPPYDAYCWRDHREGLTSETHERCRHGCGWLICHCGSCWCDMPDEKKAKYRVWPKYVEGAVTCPKCNARPVKKTRAGTFIRCPECGGKGYLLQE